MEDVLSHSTNCASSGAPHFVKCSSLPYIRSELFANTPITVFADEREALSVARDLAEMKTAQGDNFPFYVMDMGRVEQLLDDWRIHLPRVQPFYSIRCNSDPVLLHMLVDQPDIGFYCMARAEVQLAMELVSPERVLYGNPLWTRGNVRHACESRVPLLVVETEEDIIRVHASYSHANVILKVCMNPSVNENAMQIGCHPNEAASLLAMAASIELGIVGISFSIGAGSPSLGIYSHAIAQSRRLFDVGIALGHSMCVLDIGGGFPGITASVGPSFAQVALAVNEALDSFFPECTHGEMKVIAEPGRYFAASSFSLITNIVDKRAIDASLVTNDAFDSGSAGFIYQTNEGFYGSFGCRLSPHCEPRCQPLLHVDDALAASTYATILGPTLTDSDIVQPVALLPQMKIGEWLLWNDMGAYSMGNRETLGEEDLHIPTVYYFVANRRWEHISRPSSPEQLPCVGEAGVGLEEEHRETDCHSLESLETASVMADDDSFWMFGGRFLEG